ncbi:hypothetical protein KAT08_03575 [Candidatus Babeliales bacterium]|nr:hypothetical protein [Candidatus Babeliales bacterium]
MKKMIFVTILLSITCNFYAFGRPLIFSCKRIYEIKSIDKCHYTEVPLIKATCYVKKKSYSMKRRIKSIPSQMPEYEEAYIPSAKDYEEIDIPNTENVPFTKKEIKNILFYVIDRFYREMVKKELIESWMICDTDLPDIMFYFHKDYLYG